MTSVDRDGTEVQLGGVARHGPVRDVTDVLVGFARTLRHAGVPASPDRVLSMIGALAHLDVTAAEDVYWAGRLTLCGDPADIERYDAAFASYFGRRQPASPRPGAPAVPVPQTVAVDVGTPAAGDRSPAPAHSVRASGQDRLRHRDVATLSAAESEQLRHLFGRLTPQASVRRTRRYQRARRGRVDPGGTVRAMLAASGEPRELARARRRTRPRRLVILIDVSGSMAPYADTMLRFAHAAVRRHPAGTEVFTLGTRLTRVTRELRLRIPDHALAAAGRAIPDWNGGTRLGDVVRAFLDRWGQRGVARGAVVLVCSDGWERGDAELLGAQMQRLARLAHRVVWVNPHRGKDGFAPATAGMRAALPHVDALVAGHTFAALEELSDLLART